MQLTFSASSRNRDTPMQQLWCYTLHRLWKKASAESGKIYDVHCIALEKQKRDAFPAAARQSSAMRSRSIACGLADFFPCHVWRVPCAPAGRRGGGPGTGMLRGVHARRKKLCKKRGRKLAFSRSQCILRKTQTQIKMSDLWK